MTQHLHIVHSTKLGLRKKKGKKGKKDVILFSFLLKQKRTEHNNDLSVPFDFVLIIQSCIPCFIS